MNITNGSMIKIALAMIVKGADEEVELLKECLANVSPHVDGIFITITKNKGCDPSGVEEVAKFYNAEISWFDWVNDFSKARNYNFSQVSGDYSHILWCDADDTFEGLEKLRPSLEEYDMVDTFSMFYRYEFDEFGTPTVIHQKTQVIKNNDCVEWAGELHEDFREKRTIRRRMLKGINREHSKTDDRINVTRERNLEVARAGLKNKPDDPRSYWNLGNALFGVGQMKESQGILEKFLGLSSSDEEKYLTRLRLAAIKKEGGDVRGAIDDARMALGTRPDYPDAYFYLGALYDSLGNYKEAAEHFLAGLVKNPPYYSIIVYNPRDYDYNPMSALAKVFIKQFRPDLALIMLEKCQEIQPDNKILKQVIIDMKKEVRKFSKVLAAEKKISKIKNLKKLKAFIEALPGDVRQYPSIAQRYNREFAKESSSGKDLVIYCGPTTHIWNPKLMKKEMVGGSEEAIIHISKELNKLGWNVTVYANTGDHRDKMYGDVLWRPFWVWNYRDKQDVVILWRSPLACDYPINCDKVYVDLHDVVKPAEFTSERMEKITGVFFKTNYHRGLYDGWVSDEKSIVVPNGQDFGLFREGIKKNQYLMVNTSSPDRCMSVLTKLFKRVKEQVPEARLKWAYGWGVFDAVHMNDPKMMNWKEKTIKEMEDAGIEILGKIPQHEAADLYQEANIYAYPTEFPEIDCISVKKAQAVGCLPVTTDYAALNERVQHGIKIPTRKGKEEDSQYDFGVQNEQTQNEWVDVVVKLLKEPVGDRIEMREWSKQFSWDKIAKHWDKILS